MRCEFVGTFLPVSHLIPPARPHALIGEGRSRLYKRAVRTAVLLAEYRTHFPRIIDRVKSTLPTSVSW
jgi:hypothetical protein